MKKNTNLKLIGAIFVLQLLAGTVAAQKQFNVLDWKTDVSLNTHLVQQMHAQYKARQVAFNNALTNKANTLAYIRSIQLKFKTVLGELPTKANLNAKITGRLQQNGYRIEKVVYESFKNHHVTANLYLPDGDGKHPAVLLFCGHEDLAKATASYQQTAILFATQGFAVFVIDPISQSERVQLTDQNGKALTRGSTTEHTLLNLSANLVGTSVAAYQLFDNIRGLDYLVSRTEIDANKIGCIGNSGGAMQAIYFAAFDQRIKIIAPCSYLASRAGTLASTGAADGCAQIPNEGFEQLEMSDYLIAAAPKPILVLAGRYDFIPYNGTLNAYQELEQVYKSLGAAQNLALFSYDDGHGISKPKRERAVQWFRQWFFNDNRPIVEKDLDIATDLELFASVSGKISTSYPNEVNVVQQNLNLYQSKANQRNAFAKQPIALRRQKIQQLLGIRPNNNPITVEEVAKVAEPEAGYVKLIIRKQGSMPIPVLAYYPKQEIKKVMLWVSDDGKQQLAARSKLINAYLAQGYALIMADLSGTGETTDQAAQNDPKYMSKDYRNAMLALHIGKPLVGQRTSEVLSLVEFINKQTKLAQLPVEISSTGLVGIAVLHAAFLNPDIHKIDVQSGFSSYLEMLNQPLVADRYGIVIYGVLAHYDLPDLLAWIGKDRLAKTHME